MKGGKGARRHFLRIVDLRGGAEANGSREDKAQAFLRNLEH